MNQVLSALMCIILLCSFQFRETIKGNGNIKKENRKATYFTGIALSVSMNVQMDFGKGNALTVEADENFFPHIETTIKNAFCW